MTLQQIIVEYWTIPALIIVGTLIGLFLKTVWRCVNFVFMADGEYQKAQRHAAQIERVYNSIYPQAQSMQKKLDELGGAQWKLEGYSNFEEKLAEYRRRLDRLEQKAIRVC